MFTKLNKTALLSTLFVLPLFTAACGQPEEVGGEDIPEDAIATTRTFEDSTPRRAQPFGKSNNFPHSIASRLGVEPRVAVWEKGGGNSPQHLVNEFATRLANGEFRMVLIAGGKLLYDGMTGVFGS